VKRVVTVFFGLVVCAGVWGYEWPLSGPGIVASFAERRGDYFLPGVSLTGDDDQVLPIDHGETVFVWDGGAGTPAIPSGLGAYVVLEHDRGIRSAYGHLAFGSVEDMRRTIRQGDPVGRVGNSGFSKGNQLYLQITDMELRQIVNPLLLLPALADARRPVVEAPRLLRQGTEQQLGELTTAESGRVDIVARIYDVSEHLQFRNPIAPYHVVVLVNGEETFELRYDSLQEEEGKFLLSGAEETTLSRLYYGQWDVRLGSLELMPGEYRMEILARDFAGTEATRSFTVRVQ
jgi:hypothetical protein